MLRLGTCFSHNCASPDLNTNVLSVFHYARRCIKLLTLNTYQKYSIQVGDVCRDCILFDNIAAILGNIQCPKRIVNGYDIFVSIISKFQR